MVDMYDRPHRDSNLFGVGEWTKSAEFHEKISAVNYQHNHDLVFHLHEKA